MTELGGSQVPESHSYAARVNSDDPHEFTVSFLCLHLWLSDTNVSSETSEAKMAVLARCLTALKRTTYTGDLSGADPNVSADVVLGWWWWWGEGGRC